METSSDVTKISAALTAAQAEFGPVAFDAVNPFFKSRYASLGSVIELARPILERHGLAVIQPVYGSNGEIGVETRIIHNSGEWISERVSLPIDTGGKSIAQAAGSTITYLRRYGLASMLGLYADEDTDANETRYVQPVATAPAKPAAPAAPPAAPQPVDPVVLALQKAGVIPSDAHQKHIDGFMALLPFEAGDPIEWKIQFGHMYRQARNSGKDTAGAVIEARGAWAAWAVENQDAVPSIAMPAWADKIIFGNTEE
jgi:hypothetical protein